VNIVVLEEAEVGATIPRGDRRWEHIKKVLKKRPGDRLAAGIVDGPLGEAVVLELDDSGLVLGFEAARDPPPLAPLRLILGFPRPIQAARILRDLTTLGLAEIHLTSTELGEKSYTQSSIFRDRDFRGHLIEGAEQAGNPRLPRVSVYWSLRLCLNSLTDGGPDGGGRIFLHPYGDPELMGAATLMTRSAAYAPRLTLAVGSERGWSKAEIDALTAAGFVAKCLGGRILKTETAAIAACVLALAGLGLI
jgi:RsmE family RNA methyltransferase